MKPTYRYTNPEEKVKIVRDYCNDGDDTFFINSECILAIDHRITIGKTYILVGYPLLKKIELKPVILLSVLYEDGMANIILKDLISGFKYICTFCLHCPDSICEMMVVDIDYFLNKLKK